MISNYNVNLDGCSSDFSIDIDTSGENDDDLTGIHISVYEGAELKHSISIERPERGGLRISDESLKDLAAMVRS